MAWLVLALIVGMGILLLVVQEHRKGDYAFRIRKLQKRTSEMLSQLMKIREETDYLELLQEPKKRALISELEAALDTANDQVVKVTDGLAALLKRARSWLDFGDLYVYIGIQEEALEDAEAHFHKAREIYEKLSGSPLR